MTKVFDRAAVAACIAITALSLAVSAAEGRDLDRSVSRGSPAAASALATTSRSDQGTGLPSLRGTGAAPLSPLAPRRKRTPRRFDKRVAPRPDCELGLHGCFVRNGDRHGAF